MRAQVKQVFIFIFTIIVVGIVLIMGVRSIIRVNTTACDAEQVAFIRQLDSDLRANTVYGREREMELTRPCDYNVICFVDARSIQSGQTLVEFSNYAATEYTLDDEDQKVLITRSVKQKAEQNIFLIKKGEFKPIGYNELIHLPTNDRLSAAVNIGEDNTIDVPTYAYCIPVRAGRFSFKVEGQGRSVLLK